MAVEITGLPPLVAQGTGKKTASEIAPENAGQSKKPLAGNADVVTLTSQAARLQALEADINKQSVVDDNRVENLKAAIDAGNYEIDPTRVAEKFIEFEFSLSA